MPTDANQIKNLRTRAQRMGLPLSGSQFGHELALLEMTEDSLLAEHLERQLGDTESRFQSCPFLEPPPEVGIEAGLHHVLGTPSGRPVRISFDPRAANGIAHLGLYGITGKGKSCAQGVIASQAAESCFTVVFDVNRVLRGMPAMRSTHQFVRWTDFRLNIFDVVQGVPAFQVDQVMVSTLCRSYSLQFAEYEINQVAGHLRKNGVPSLPAVLDALKNVKVQGFSKRGQYRDSAILVINNLLEATGELFRCAEGMELRKILAGNIVIEVDGLLVEHQSFLISYFFEYLNLCALRDVDGI